VELQLYSFLTSAVGEACRPRPLNPRGSTLPLPIDYEAGWTGLDASEKSLLPLPGLEPGLCHHVATELFEIQEMEFVQIYVKVKLKARKALRRLRGV
jgi:hypothetical protein